MSINRKMENANATNARSQPSPRIAMAVAAFPRTLTYPALSDGGRGGVG
jgi:hypothetical protein